MYRPDPGKVAARLEKQYRYPPRLAQRVAENTPALPDLFAPAIEAWLAGRELPDVEVDGISLAAVISTRRTNPLTAAILLGDLLAPNLPAEKRADRRRMLTTPVKFE